MSPATVLAPAPAPAPVRRTGHRPFRVPSAPLVPAVLAAALQVVGSVSAGLSTSPFAAAVWAGTRSTTAWFLGSFDAAGAVGVSGPPAALWLAGLSVRAFGSTTASLLLPQVLAAGLAAAGSAVVVGHRRGSWPGTVTGSVLALLLAAGALLGAGPALPLVALAGVVATGGILLAAPPRRRRTGPLLLAGLGTSAALLTSVVGGLVVATAVVVALLLTTLGTGRRVRGLSLLVVTVAVTVGGWAGATSLLPATTSTVTAGSSSTGPATAAEATLVPLLQAAGTTWSAAVVEPAGTAPQWSAQLQLASATSVLPVSAVGPTLGQFQAAVATGRLHYLLVPADGGGDAITGWVAARYATTGTTTADVAVYDLTAPLG